MYKKLMFATVMTLLLILLPVMAIAAEQNNPVPPVPPAPAGETQQVQDGNSKPIEGTNFKEIRNDLTSLTSDIVVQKDERVHGNITTAVGDITVYGQVIGNITTGAGDVNLKNKSRVEGNITVGAGNVNREPEAEVTGNVVQGRQGIHKGIIVNNQPEYQKNAFERAIDSFKTLLGLLAIIAIILSIFPQNLGKMMKAFNIEPGRVVGIGVLGWLLLPFALLISIITIIGPVILGLGALVSVLVGAAIISLLLGEKIKELFNWQNDNKILTAIIGLLVLWLASQLPIVQFFIILTSAVIGMGVVLVTKFGTGRPWFPSRQTVVNTNPINEIIPLEPKDDNGGREENDPPQN